MAVRPSVPACVDQGAFAASGKPVSPARVEVSTCVAEDVIAGVSAATAHKVSTRVEEEVTVNGPPVAPAIESACVDEAVGAVVGKPTSVSREEVSACVGEAVAVTDAPDAPTTAVSTCVDDGVDAVAGALASVSQEEVSA